MTPPTPTPNQLPTVLGVGSLTPEAIADTLAYYHCRRVNPKADHPIMGYHTFSEDQREFLRDRQSEAAAEIHRMIVASAAQAKAEALREAADEFGSWGPTGIAAANALRNRAATIESGAPNV